VQRPGARLADGIGAAASVLAACSSSPEQGAGGDTAFVKVNSNRQERCPSSPPAGPTAAIPAGAAGPPKAEQDRAAPRTTVEVGALSRSGDISKEFEDLLTRLPACLPGTAAHNGAEHVIE